MDEQDDEGTDQQEMDKGSQMHDGESEESENEENRNQHPEHGCLLSAPPSHGRAAIGERTAHASARMVPDSAEETIRVDRHSYTFGSCSSLAIARMLPVA